MSRVLFIFCLGEQVVTRAQGFEQANQPELVYDQSIYLWLFDDRPPVHPVYGVYNKHSPPLRKDDMTRYYDGMDIFQHSIDNFVNHHCDPYVRFLTSKFCYRLYYTVFLFRQFESGRWSGNHKLMVRPPM